MVASSSRLRMLMRGTRIRKEVVLVLTRYVYFMLRAMVYLLCVQKPKTATSSTDGMQQIMVPLTPDEKKEVWNSLCPLTFVELLCRFVDRNGSTSASLQAGSASQSASRNSYLHAPRLNRGNLLRLLRLPLPTTCCLLMNHVRSP